MGLKVPPDAIVEQASEVDDRGQAARLVVVLPTAAWERWRAELVPSRPDQPAFRADQNHQLGADDGAWTPGKARGLTTVQVPWREASSLNIGQAPAGDGKIRVFFFLVPHLRRTDALWMVLVSGGG